MKLALGIFPNPEKEKVLAVLDYLLDVCAAEGIETFLPKSAALGKACGIFDERDAESMGKLKMAMSLGGDGTFLHAAQYACLLDIPVCGVNIGRKGFLTEIELPDIAAAIKKIAAAQYEIEERYMLRSSVRRDGRVISDASALNDIVISKGTQTKLIRLSVNINNSLKGSYYSADGIVFATATGSTAYSLSAGGPIVHPSLPAIIITPISPHALSVRPLVIPAASEIAIKPVPPYNEMTLANDGTTLTSVLPGDVVKVESSRYKSKFIRLGSASYYDTWQERLQKGETI
ncbi:MAG: NAD(+)/NADH kinase [Acidaminococcales bacterium]|nr:NAD(+)/NADH kinase [Acidaminococcales bacterium]